MYELVEPNDWVALRLPSESLKLVQIVPNSSISLGKFGTFQANGVLSRPYHFTYEILDKQPGQVVAELRIVSASELHADTIAEEEAAAKGGDLSDENVIFGGDGVEFQLVDSTGEVVMRSNRETIDDSTRQMLTHDEIEALKKDGAGAGKDLIAKLMMSHTGMDEKTAFSLAKYKLSKTRKFLRQFTILPLDMPTLTQWVIDDKDANRVLEMSEEVLGLVGCWGNVHFVDCLPGQDEKQGRWLIVDEVGGLLVGAMAERMGILRPEPKEEIPTETDTIEGESGEPRIKSHPNDPNETLQSSNTITLIHANSQPNLSLLKYFDFNPDTPSPNHPLSRHLRTLSWLQLLSPTSDGAYSTVPEIRSAEEIAAMKSGRKGNYYRKWRRYNKIRNTVDQTREGGFDGLLVASNMEPVGILKSCLALLAGGAQVVIYSPTVEPLVQLADYYSTSRRTAWICTQNAAVSNGSSLEMNSNHTIVKGKTESTGDEEDFPLDPTLLLNTTVQTSKIRQWQVLPGRTHPLMTGRGGAEGYIFTATKVLPASGKIEARGKYKRRKVVNSTDSNSSSDKERVGVVEDDMKEVVYSDLVKEEELGFEIE